MSEGAVHYHRTGANREIAHIIFDRPAARNAMTWTMYQQMTDACKSIAADAGVRVAVFRGTGGKAFVAGTDISQFLDFKSGEDGIAYERRISEHLEAVETLPMPTLAVIEGWAIGGGLAIATACDLRIATPGSRFGVPIARTLGNCLSVENAALIANAFGHARTKKMLLLAENLTDTEALACGYLSDIVAPDALDARITGMCERIIGNAPITMQVTKEALRRALHASLPAATEGEDLIRACYGSDDFRIGREAFVAKQTPRWTGR